MALHARAARNYFFLFLGFGYTDFHHLLPAFAGLGVFLLGLELAYPYLAGKQG